MQGRDLDSGAEELRLVLELVDPGPATERRDGADRAIPDADFDRAGVSHAGAPSPAASRAAPGRGPATLGPPSGSRAGRVSPERAAVSAGGRAGSAPAATPPGC